MFLSIALFSQSHHDSYLYPRENFVTRSGKTIQKNGTAMRKREREKEQRGENRDREVSEGEVGVECSLTKGNRYHGALEASYPQSARPCRPCFVNIELRACKDQDFTGESVISGGTASVYGLLAKNRATVSAVPDGGASPPCFSAKRRSSRSFILIAYRSVRGTTCWPCKYFRSNMLFTLAACLHRRARRRCLNSRRRYSMIFRLETNVGSRRAHRLGTLSGSKLISVSLYVCVCVCEREREIANKNSVIRKIFFFF